MCSQCCMIQAKQAVYICRRYIDYIILIFGKSFTESTLYQILRHRSGIRSTDICCFTDYIVSPAHIFINYFRQFPTTETMCPEISCVKNFQFLCLNTESVGIKCRVVDYYRQNIKFTERKQFAGSKGGNTFKSL